MHTKPASREAVIRRLPFAIFVVCIFVILSPLILNPTFVPFPPKSPYTDLLISHLPNALLAHDTLFIFRQFPLWNPLILNGLPFAADPLSGLWYLPNWLTILFPSPLAFNILLVLHSMWAGWGMYRWARADDFAELPALLGALAFAGMPKIVAHLAAGHISTVFAFAWTPFLLHVTTRKEFKTSHFLLLTFYLAIIFFADMRYFAYAITVAMIFLLANFRQNIIRFAPFLVLFALLTAVAWLPLLELLSYSSRAELTTADANALALPLASLLGVLVPNLGGNHEWQTYLGIAPLVLAVLGALKTRNLQSVIFILLIFFSIWFSLGAQAGLFAVISKLPLASLLRVPARAWFVVGLAMAWLAVRGAEWLLNGNTIKDGRLLLAVAASLWAFGLGGSYLAQKVLINFIGAALIFTLVLLALRSKHSLIYLLLITFLELTWVNTAAYEMKPLPTNPVAQWLSEQSGVWRIYSPSYSVPQQFVLQHADGVNPMQLTEVTRAMKLATGVACEGYSVTVPCFKEAVESSNRDAKIDAQLLGEFNVRYVASEFEIKNDFLIQRMQIGTTHIYENKLDMGRVRGGDLISWTPNRQVVQVMGVGTLILSETWYPGWRAWADGVEVPVERVGVFRAVTLTSGVGELVFEFQPLSVYVGMLLSGGGLLIFMNLCFSAWRRR